MPSLRMISLANWSSSRYALSLQFLCSLFGLPQLTTYRSGFQVTPGHITKSDAVQIAFLMLVAGNATMVNMINLVSFNSPKGLLKR
jgi:hypothetical protein